MRKRYDDFCFSVNAFNIQKMSVPFNIFVCFCFSEKIQRDMMYSEKDFAIFMHFNCLKKNRFFSFRSGLGFLQLDFRCRLVQCLQKLGVFMPFLLILN